jgi:hypothetical protein
MQGLTGTGIYYECQMLYPDSVYGYIPKCAEKKWYLDIQAFYAFRLVLSVPIIVEQPPVFRNDVLTAYWDSSRGVFVPVAIPSTIRWARISSGGGIYTDFSPTIHVKFLEMDYEPTTTVHPTSLLFRSDLLKETTHYAMARLPPLASAGDLLQVGTIVGLQYQPPWSWVIVAAGSEILTNCLPV